MATPRFDVRPRARLTRDAVNRGLALRARGASYRTIALELGCALHTVRDFCKGRTWTRMDPENRAPFRTPSGRLVDLSRPDPAVLDLEDIAHCLARTCRFNGAVAQYYSVASHSVYVARHLPARLATAGLLHDAAEAYLGDVTSGLKRLFPEYRELERRWELAVERRFGVAFVGSGLIKTADLRARLAEARDLFGEDGYPREELLGGADATLTPFETPCVAQTPDEAEWAFLAAARELGLLQ